MLPRKRFPPYPTTKCYGSMRAGFRILQTLRGSKEKWRIQIPGCWDTNAGCYVKFGSAWHIFLLPDLGVAKFKLLWYMDHDSPPPALVDGRNNIIIGIIIIIKIILGLIICADAQGPLGFVRGRGREERARRKCYKKHVQKWARVLLPPPLKWISE